MKNVRLKICGVRLNPEEIARLQPDYMGFIFYAKSKRFFDGELPDLPDGIKKVGVFVDASISDISAHINRYHLDVVQLHGDETPDFCKELSMAEPKVKLWKVFSIKDEFDFQLLEAYETVVDYYLFDTKGKEKGGNGFRFNWSALKGYPSSKPFILSGGIGLEELHDLRDILKTNLPIHAIDVNSRFESEPGLKNINDLKIFIDEL